jgi:hypothetical protein
MLKLYEEILINFSRRREIFGAEEGIEIYMIYMNMMITTTTMMMTVIVVMILLLLSPMIHTVTLKVSASNILVAYEIGGQQSLN